MERRSYEFILEAQTPIAHHSRTEGNQALFMTQKVRQRDGSFANVPIITGDTLRHGLREAGAYALLDAAGMIADPVLSEGALRLLFAGGMVTGRGDGSVIKMEQYRKLAELVPQLQLLGGCTDNRVVPGATTVEAAQLICDETMHFMPDWVKGWLAEQGIGITTRRSYVENVQRVRMDPTLDPNKRKLLSGDATKWIEAKSEKAEEAHSTGDSTAIQEAKSSMMPRSFETLVQGSLFFWRTSALVHDDLDADTFLTMLGALFRYFVVGGKKGTGCGKLRAVVGTPARITRPSDKVEVIDPRVLGDGAGKLFGEHVKARAAEIREYLREVNA